MVTRFTATVKATVVQLIDCVYCNSLSVYEMTVAGRAEKDTSLFTSEASAKEGARSEAQKDLDALFKDAEQVFEAIPCRKCHQYQPYMFQRVAQQRHDPLGCLGCLLLSVGGLTVVGAAVAFVFARTNVWTIGAVGVTGLLAWLSGYLISVRIGERMAQYDPNLDGHEQRARIAAAKALSLDEYDERQAINLRYHYKNYVAATRPARLSPGGAAGLQPLIVEWRVVPSVLESGRVIEITLSETESVSLQIPASTLPGTLLPLATRTETVVPFLLRVVAFTVHPGEMRE